MLVNFVLWFVFAAAAVLFIHSLQERESKLAIIADATCLLGLIGLMIYFGVRFLVDLVIWSWS